MNNKAFILIALSLVALSIYLFASAPQPLPDTGLAAAAKAGSTVPIENVLQLLAAENDIARALYTKEIVGAGKKAGLAFDEDWRDPEVEAGPLPALFLREIAISIEKNPVELGLFLGSDFPISPANGFQGIQAEKFKVIRETEKAEIFYAEDTGRHTAMFPDYGSVMPCISCHNEHPGSPKKDWVLGDMMGATTWSYPREAVTTEEFLTILTALRQGFADAYLLYLADAAAFSKPPEIGEGWPRDGYQLPSAEVFMEEFSSRASSASLTTILDTQP